ncbi:type II toxin-antitoxin system YafQ family toxin [Yersinia sp. 2466 StPb PI]|uniref:type II toxin-antitoxin system YafQ family toxin n=1 Tax=Yersinia TaxID=629 RepID=UPI00355B26C1
MLILRLQPKPILRLWEWICLPVGNYIGYLECHGAPKLLLVYQQTATELKLYRVGSHADLFG